MEKDNLIAIGKESELMENESKLMDISKELLMDARSESKPSDAFLSIPIAQLSTLGAGVSSLIPAFNTVTQTTTISTQGLYRIANAAAGDILKMAKDGNFWGAMKNAEGVSKMAKLKAADTLTATTTTVVGANPAVLMMAAAIFVVEHELGKIEEMEKQIISFLEIEKQSEIEADIVTLNDIIKKYKHSWDNEHFITSNHKMVCDIQRDARKHMISFQKSASEIINKKQLIVAGAKVATKYRDLLKKFKYYRLSLYTYSLASMLEIMLSGNFKEEIISDTIEEIEKYSTEYRTLFTDCSRYLETQSDKSIEINVIKGLGTASNTLGKAIGSIPKVKDGQLDEFLQEKGAKIRQNASDVSREVIGAFAEVSDPSTGLFIEKMHDMVTIYNKTTEICFDKNNIYLIA